MVVDHNWNIKQSGLEIQMESHLTTVQNEDLAA